jgi:excisionase family DNA binding protein
MPLRYRWAPIETESTTIIRQERIMRDQYLTVNEVCDLLNLKKTFVYKLVNTGKIPHLRFEKLIRFRQSDVDQWITENVVN